MMKESNFGDYVPFSELRGLDIPPKMSITRHLIDGLASVVESTDERHTLADLVPQISATIALLVDTVRSLEEELLAVREPQGNGPA